MAVLRGMYSAQSAHSYIIYCLIPLWFVAILTIYPDVIRPRPLRPSTFLTWRVVSLVNGRRREFGVGFLYGAYIPRQ